MEASSMVTEGDGELAITTLQQQLQFLPPINPPNALLPDTALLRQNQHVSISVNLENSEQDAVHLTLEGEEYNAHQDLFGSPNGQNQIELTSVNNVNPNHDSSILFGAAGQTLNSDVDEQHTTPHNYSDPKDVAYLLRVYPFIMGLVAWKFTQEKPTPTPTSNPFIIISILAYITAYTNLVILSCMYDLLSNPIHQRQLLNSHHYLVILKYSFYIFCILAHFSLMPILFIPYPQN